MEAIAIQLETVRRRQERRQLRILSACIAGSLVLHLLGWAWVASRREPVRRPVPTGYMVVEQRPALPPPLPPAPVADEAGRSAAGPPARAAPRATRAPAQGNPGDVQRKAFLRALGSVGNGPIARGLPGTVASADAPSGVPDTPVAEATPSGPPARRGGDGSAPAAVAAPGKGGDPGGFGAGVGEGGGGIGAGIAVGAGTVDSGGVDRAQLEAFVRGRIGGLRACYETELRRDPSRGGTVRVRFVIKPTGEVTDVVVGREGLDSPVLADCLARILRTWTTPFRPPGRVPVEVPFAFRPVGR